MAPFVFDACALIALLRGEDGAPRLSVILRNEQCTIHAVNLCEVFYDFLRAGEVQMAEEIFLDVERLHLGVVRDISDSLLMAAGRLKVRYKIALADCFAAALANDLGAVVVTSDRKEFTSLVEDGACRVEFFR